ncbi:fibronectin type III domain-containing protein [Patescibacteria group bacterium]|nr:fibronectin type III domain-containing protein [Patescibacteria group bacterium]
MNVGDTSTYDFSVYVYDSTSGNVGGTVSSSVAQLYYNGAVVSTTYTDAGSGWWKLSGTLTGANESRQYGVLVKAGKTVKVDDFTLSKSGTYSVYTTSAYSNAQVNSWDTFCEGTLVGSTCTTDATYSGNAAIYYQICLDNGSSCSYSSGSRWQYYTGGAWTNATDATTTYANTAAQLTQAAMQALSVTSQKISVKAILTFGGSDLPYLPHISIGLTTDTTAPDTNASAVAMTRTNGGTSVSSNAWTNGSSPYFSWTAGADNSGGSGLKGYCLYLGTDSNGDPATAKGLLGTSPVSTTGTTCQFIVSGTSVDFATSSYKGGTWLSTSSNPYYLNVKAIDNSGNVYGGSSAQFQFRFDNTAPTNSSYISCASGSFSNVADMNFSWPTSGSAASSDDNAGLLGWQYQINSTSGTWLGTTTESTLGVGNYIPSTATSRTLTEAQDGSSIVSGNNIVYVRTVDAAGNISADATIRTCNLSYGGAAPAFGGTDTVTVTPSTSTSNSYALSWPAATPANGQTVTHYYYMVNTSPPSTLATLQGNASTYIDNGTAITVSAAALAGVNKGSNTVYVVAIDGASTPNYSPSNYISGTFTLNSTDPDNVGSLVASDSSIKSQSQWNVTLTWTAPTYQGAGNLTYLVYRSTNGSTFSQVGSTSGLSYVDNTPSSALYYYKVYTKDGAAATSSGTNAVSITPTGKWTSAPSLDSGPSAGSITTKKATITWSTSRSSDSKVEYGTKTGDYGDVEPSNSSQVTSHSIQLTGLNPGTTYYYKAKWTDEDGNTGTSDEKSFTTSPAPTVKDVSAKNIALTSAIIQFTSKDASKVKIYYGKTTSFGGAKETSTSTSETIYTSELTGLDDGTKYYYKINTFDSEGSEYEGTILDFTTLPRPRITNVRIQQVANTAQSTILVTWSTNTEISSIVTYYPQGSQAEARDEVNVALTSGDHKMIVRGLSPQTDYILIVKGRDKIGNEALSDSQKFTTATDTRPPQISDINVEGAAVPPTSTTAQESTAQLIVSWNTDEPATSQVEFGEGTGVTYSSKTQEDDNLTFNHIVIISGLTPSKVYHLRALSKDKAGNIGNSIDTVTITPKATENALNLVVTNLQEAFGFLGGLKK